MVGCKQVDRKLLAADAWVSHRENCLSTGLEHAGAGRKFPLPQAVT